MDETAHLINLFQRYLEGSATEPEMAELMIFLGDAQYAALFEEIIGNAFVSYQDESAIAPEQIEVILQHIFAKTGTDKVIVIQKPMLWKRIAVAASIILCLSFASLFILHQQKALQSAQRVSSQKSILPGGNKATLTLANGSKIILTTAKTGKLALQANSSIHKAADNEIVYNPTKNQSAKIDYNVLATPRGGQYTLVLADGTKVWLNASSSIKYPTSFHDNYRTVEISGEVYFEVVHNQLQPFRVIAAGQVIEDIGTAFNVNAYPDEHLVKTTLVTGAVEVRGKDKRLRLKPGQQAVNDPGGNHLSAATVDISSVTAWRNGYFRFDNAEMATIMRQFARWYNIEVSYEGNIGEHEFVGRISRNSSLQKVLKVLTDEGVHYRLTDNKLTILP